MVLVLGEFDEEITSYFSPLAQLPVQLEFNSPKLDFSLRYWNLYKGSTWKHRFSLGFSTGSMLDLDNLQQHPYFHFLYPLLDNHNILKWS